MTDEMHDAMTPGGHDQAPAGPADSTGGSGAALPGAPPVRTGGGSSGIWIALVGIVAGLVVLSEAAGVGWVLSRSQAAHPAAAAPAPIRTAPQITSSESPTGQDQQLSLPEITRKITPAVVDINTTVATLGQPAQAAGTGILLTSSGEVLTNHHVVEGSTSIRVTLAGGSRSYAATVVGVAPAADVALLQLEGASGLTSATVADSSRLSVGQPVVAVGNAFGQGGAPSVTQGTITALNQTITVNAAGGRAQEMSGLIQSDAKISPGDSGGPLVNSAGQVVGMITAGETQGRRQTTSTIGYAIPSNTALRFVNLIRSGQAGPEIIIGQRGYLGVSVRNLDAATAGRLGLPITSGVLVAGVAADSPAAQAGITQNAVITAIDGAAVATADALGPAIRAHKPGERMQVSWIDQAGNHHSATVTLIAGPAA